MSGYDRFKLFVAVLLLLLIGGLFLVFRNPQAKPPTLSAELQGGKVVFFGTAAPGAKVTIRLNGKTLTAVADEAGRFRVESALAPGAYQAVAEVQGAASPPLSIRVPAPLALEPPERVGEAYRIRGSAEPGAEVVLYLDGAKVATLKAGPDGRFAYLLKPSPGRHELKATYPGGAEGARLRLSVPAPAPKLSRHAVQGRTLVVEGEAPPGTPVALWVDGKQVASATAGEDGRFRFSVELEPGAHQAWVEAKGQASEAVSLTIAPPPPPKAKAPGRAYVVQKGDTLSAIAKRYLGDPRRYPEIRDATNQKAQADPNFDQIENVDRIYPGERLWIPAP